MRPRGNYGSKRVPKKDQRASMSAIITTRLTMGPELTERDIESIARTHDATVAEVHAEMDRASAILREESARRSGYGR